MTILNCLSGRATNREQRTIDQAPPSFRHGSTETLDGSGIILHRAYSVNLLNLTRLPAERCAVLASVYLLGSDRRCVTSIISYLCVARKMEPYPRWKCFCSLSKPLHPHNKHVISSTCTVFAMALTHQLHHQLLWKVGTLRQSVSEKYNHCPPLATRRLVFQ